MFLRHHKKLEKYREFGVHSTGYLEFRSVSLTCTIATVYFSFASDVELLIYE